MSVCLSAHLYPELYDHETLQAKVGCEVLLLYLPGKKLREKLETKTKLFPAKKNSIINLKMNLDDDFSFPFQPYQIQVNFMKKLFDVLDNQKLGIFESRKEFQFRNAIEKNVNF